MSFVCPMALECPLCPVPVASMSSVCLYSAELCPACPYRQYVLGMSSLKAVPVCPCRQYVLSMSACDLFMSYGSCMSLHVLMSLKCDLYVLYVLHVRVTGMSSVCPVALGCPSCQYVLGMSSLKAVSCMSLSSVCPQHVYAHYVSRILPRTFHCSFMGSCVYLISYHLVTNQGCNLREELFNCSWRMLQK